MEATATTDTTRSAVPRTWRSLLTGGWHCSSWVVAAAVLLFLVFCNVPGQLTNAHHDWAGIFGIEPQYEHGWPLTWGIRRPEVWWGIADAMSCWPFNNEALEIHWPSLAANALCLAAAAGMAGVAFEMWRQRRKHLLQLHVRDLMAALLAVSLVGAWYLNAQRRYARQFGVVGASRINPFEDRSPEHGISSCFHTEGGPTWLRRLVGDHYFQFLDRVTAISMNREGLPWISELPDLRVVEVTGDVTSRDLCQLEQARSLEVLQISSEGRALVEGSTSVGYRVSMPRLPLVRRVVAVDTYCQDLANLPSLESLALTSEPIDRPMMRQILSLPKLTELEIVNCRLAAVDLGELAALDRLKKLSLQTMRLEKQQFDGLGKLTQLEELEIGACDLFHAHFRQLSSMPNLRRLDVVNGGFTSATIPHLASLTQVESLTLGSATIDLHVARHICRMPRLRELELTFCRVDEEAAECLVGMKPLQVLHLPEGFSAESQEKLQAMMGDRKVTFLDYNRVFLK